MPSNVKHYHVFLKKCAFSLAILNFSYSYVFIREPFVEHSSHWRCEIVRAGSSRMSLASKETPPRCYLLLLVSAYAECFSWIFRERHYKKFFRLTTNRRIMRRREIQGVCRQRKKKRKKNAKSTRTRPMLWRFSGTSLLSSSRYRSPSVWYSARTPARNSISKAALEMSMGWFSEMVISVVLRSLEELWESPDETPYLKHGFWWNNNRDVWGFK